MELRISQISRFIVQSGPIKNSLVAFSTRTIAEARAAEEVEFEGIVGIIIFPSFSFPTISLNQKNKKSSTQLEKLRFFFFSFSFSSKKTQNFCFFYQFRDTPPPSFSFLLYIPLSKKRKPNKNFSPFSFAYYFGSLITLLFWSFTFSWLKCLLLGQPFFCKEICSNPEISTLFFSSFLRVFPPSLFSSFCSAVE